MMAKRSERIRQFAFARYGVVHAICRQQPEVQSASNFDGDPIAIFLAAMEMALKFDVDVFRPEYFCQVLNRLQSRLRATLFQRRSERSVVPAGQANQAIRIFNTILLFRDRTFFSTNSQLHLRDQATEILISGARSD